MKSIALVVLPLAFVIASAQNTVQRIDKYEFGGINLTDGVKVNGGAVACGDRGTIIKRTTGSWHRVSSFIPDSVLLNDLDFKNDNVGLCVGTDGTILKTTDAGDTWSQIGSGVLENLESVAFGVNSVVCVGTNGTALISTNDGTDWTKMSTKIKSNLHFVIAVQSASAFAAVGDEGTIAGLQEGTQFWQVKQGTSSSNFYSCAAENQQGIWVGVKGGVLHSSDGGDTWISQLSSLAGTVTRLHKRGNVLVAMGSYDGTVAYTTDGANWQTVFAGDTNTYRAAILAEPPLGGELVGDQGSIKLIPFQNPVAAEQGAYNVPFYFDHLVRTDGSMWCVGSLRAIDVRSAIGIWTSHQTAANGIHTGIAMNADASIICVSCTDGNVYRSTDNGTTWTPIAVPNQTPLSAISFASSFWAVGKGLVFRSADGLAWEQVGSISNTSLYDVEASSNERAIVSGANGVLQETTDGGQNWTPLLNGVLSSIMDASVDATGTSLFVGQYGLALLKSGTSIMPLPVPQGSIMITACDIDISHGRAAAVTISGKIVYRPSPTSQWVILETASQLTDVELTDNQLTAVGEGGSVFSVDLNTLDVAEENIRAQLRVVPNPATSTLTVECEGGTELIFTTVDGKEVKRVAIENGATTITINVASMPSGVYSLSLVSGHLPLMSSALITIVH